MQAIDFLGTINSQDSCSASQSTKTGNSPEAKETKEKELRPVSDSYQDDGESEDRYNSMHSSSSYSSSTLASTEPPEVFNQRWDRTSVLLSDRVGNRWKRRLDSIARLIEGPSTCAAIVIENGSFLIATNTNFTRTSVSQGYTLIDGVMSFFRRVSENYYSNSNDEKFKNDFKEIFRSICKASITGLQLSTFLRDEFVESDAFIDSVIEANQPGRGDFRSLRDYISENAEYGHYPYSQGAAFTVSVALMKDFQKVLDFIEENKYKVGDDHIALFIKAIKNYEKLNIIDRETLSDTVVNQDARKDMHAEMRVLAVITRKLKNNSHAYNNYIGISKLCCLDCHAIIYAVNNAEGFKNNIEIRGAHNVESLAAWNPPFNITGNPAATTGLTYLTSRRRKGSDASSETEPFESVVARSFNSIRRANILTDEKGRRIAGATKVSQTADYSGSSEEEGDGYYNTYCSYLEGMERILQQRQMLLLSLESKTEASQELAVIKIGLKIYRSKAFEEICHFEPITLKETAEIRGQKDFISFLGAVKLEEIEDLKKFLQTPIYSGEKVSDYFKHIGFNVNLELQGRKRRIS